MHFCVSSQFILLNRFVQKFEAILVNLITSEMFTEPLVVVSEDIALLARPVRNTLWPHFNNDSLTHCMLGCP